MKNIVYKTLKGQNFLSVGNDEINVDFQQGLNLITGKNIDNPERKNGCGKSTIAELFFYALFGTTIRNIKKEFVVNNVTKAKGNIELTFDVKTPKSTNSYKIVRKIKPSSVALYKVGKEEEDISKDSIANTNNYICELISSNQEISKSCDILSLSDSVSFMAQKPDKKRKFIEDIFSLEILGFMLKDLKLLLRDNKAETSIVEAKIDEITESRDTLKRQYDNLAKRRAEREEKLEKRRKELQNDLENAQKQLESIKIKDKKGLEEEYDKYTKASKVLDDRISKAKTDISINERLIRDFERKLADLDGKGGSKCHSCTQIIPEELVNSQIEEVKADLEQVEEFLVKAKGEFQVGTDKVVKVNDKILYLSQEIIAIDSSISKKKTVEERIERLNKDLASVDDDMNEESESMDSFDEDIAKIEKKLAENVAKKAELVQEKADLDICKFILGEEGIKSVIIKKLLDMLNASIQKYITGLGMDINCKFDEYFEEQISNAKGQPLSYWNLSGGERRTVDLACAWAFKDTKRKISGVSSNVEFLDEIFDSAFDERGVDLFIEVLKERIDRDKLSCYAISHRKETLKHIDGDIITLEKENRITRRVNDDN